MTSADDRALLERVYDGICGAGVTGTVDRTSIGDRLVAVEVDGPDGRRMGVAHRPPGEVGVRVPTDAIALARWSFDPPTAGQPLEIAIGVAALNALSAPMIRWAPGDPMGALGDDVDRIATVGLFRPALRTFDAIDVRVIEREPVGDIDAPAGVSVSAYPPSGHQRAIDGVDVLFVTGSSLVYGGTATYLGAAADVPSVVLIGATASFLPGPAFDAGATVVAGARVTDPEAVRRGIERGLCATDLHGRGLEKGYVAAEATLAGLDLDPSRSRPADGS